MSGTMKALALTSFEEPPALIDVPKPTPEAGEILVHVAAASLNPYDTFVAMGAMRDYLPYEFPAVLGMDVAGTIEALGDGVEGFAVGDRVFGKMGGKASVRDGGFGEYATPTTAEVARTPDGVDDAQAGSLGVAGTTAINAVDAVDPHDDSTVLIVGATGGVGSLAIQLAAQRGAHVIASVRPGDESFVTDLGAAETADYTGDLAAAIRERYPDGVDGVIDLVNRDPSAFAALAALVRGGGHATSAVGGAGESSEIDGVKVSNVGGDASRLAELGDLIVAGRLRVPITRTYALADAADALRDLTDQHTLGKLVIVVS